MNLPVPYKASSYLTIRAIIRISSRNMLREASWVYILIYCGSACSPEVLLYFKPNNWPPDEFFEPVTETILYVLIPRIVLNGLSVSMKCAAESSDVTSVMSLDVLSLPKRCKSTKILT
jgi:hypothetical protein